MKKVVAILPARYQSSRFEGKPLADLHGKPMIWWVYNQVKKSKYINEIYVATDDKRIEEECLKYNLNCIMTSNKWQIMLERLWEVSESIESDYYVCIPGDEPLIEPKSIDKVIKKALDYPDFNVVNAKIKIKEPVDVLNWTTMKVVSNKSDQIIYASRAPIPFPKSTVDITYYKHSGLYALKKEALDFIKNTEKGSLEKIEDFDLLRFIENFYQVMAVDLESETVSVDTPKDLERVKLILEKSGK